MAAKAPQKRESGESRLKKRTFNQTGPDGDTDVGEGGSKFGAKRDGGGNTRVLGKTTRIRKKSNPSLMGSRNTLEKEDKTG